VAILGYAAAGDTISSINIDLNRLARNPTIMTIPLFTFAGYVMAESNAPKRLIAWNRRVLAGCLAVLLWLCW
jgi:C4-dicarboxylate transporter DctM subunit